MASFSNSKHKARTFSAGLFAAALLVGLVGAGGNGFAQPPDDGYYFYHHHRHHKKIYPRIYPRVDFGFVYGNNGNVIHRRGQPCVATAMGSSHPLC